MELHRGLIYEFMKIHMGIKKEGLEKKAYRGETYFAPSKSYNPEELYKLAFEVGGEEIEIKILGKLKYFFREYEELLKDIWASKYKDFVMELLVRANVTPNKNKVMPNSDDLRERMIAIFRKAIASCDIYLLVNHPNIDSKSKLNDFLEIIKTEIEARFEQCKNEITYDRIMEFTRLLEHYANSLTYDDYNEAFSNFSDYSTIRASSDMDYLRLGKLYRELTGGRLFPIMNLSIISEGCDEELREIFLSGIPDDEQSDNSTS